MYNTDGFQLLLKFVRFRVDTLITNNDRLFKARPLTVDLLGELQLLYISESAVDFDSILFHLRSTQFQQ